LNYLSKFELFDDAPSLLCIDKEVSKKARATASGSIAIEYLHSTFIFSKNVKLATLKQSRFLYEIMKAPFSLAEVLPHPSGNASSYARAKALVPAQHNLR